MNIRLFSVSRNRATATVLLLLSMLLAIYGPVSVTNAQAVADTQKFKDLKEKVLNELDRRLDNYKKTRTSLDNEIKIMNEESSFSATSDDSDTPLTTNKTGLIGKFVLSDKTKGKIKQFSDEVIEKLQELRVKVEDTTSLEDLQSFASGIDEQLQLTQLVDVQAAVTNAIEGLTGVVDKVQTTFDNMRGQVNKMKECISANNQDTSASTSTPNCDDFNLSSEEVIVSAESQMANIDTMASIIKSVLASSVALLTSLVSTLSSLLGNLGNLDSLGNLGSLLGGGSLSSALSGSSDDDNMNGLLGSGGSLSGLLGSFSAITSQLGIANGMASNAQGLLGNLTSYVSI